MVKKEEIKHIGAGLVFSWIFSVFFIVGGFLMIIVSFFSGLLTLVAGIIILPPFNEYLEEKKKIKISRWLKIIIVLVLLAVAGSNLEVSDSSSSSSSVDTSSSAQISDTTTQTSTPSEEEQDTTTLGERNALSKAKSYLNTLAFSYSGLIKQLEYEGYSSEEAKYGVDNCGADWKEQAALKAQSYLDTMAFSREGLINQLEYEGFTKEQVEYGVEAVGY